ASGPMNVTPICTVASSVSGSSWSRLTRSARWLPAAIRGSIWPRMAESSAISLPEKKPFPSRQKKMATTRKPQSLMDGAILADRSRAAALSAPPVFDSVKSPQATRGGAVGQRRDFRPGGDRQRSRRLRGRHPGGADGPEDRGGGARPGRLRRDVPPAGLHPHQGPA